MWSWYCFLSIRSLLLSIRILVRVFIVRVSSKFCIIDSGTGDAWCGTGCQSAFGTCGTSVAAPANPPAPSTQPSTPATQPPASNSKLARLSAPYVDVLLWPTLDVTKISLATGIKYFSLAFLVADSAGNPSWGGAVPLSQQWYLSYVTALRAMGGDVIISFGGATGLTLAQVTTSVSDLQAKYQQVINMYGVKMLDFDIEGANMVDTAANDRRAQALVRLKAANPGLIISYTLPSTTTGLDWYGLSVVQSIYNNGLSLDICNIMAMVRRSSLLFLY